MRIEPADGLTPLSSTLPGKVSILITSEDIDDDGGEGYKWQEKGQVIFPTSNCTPFSIWCLICGSKQ